MGGARLARWSIGARLTFLSVVLIAVLIGTNLNLSRKLVANGEALAESGRFLEAVTAAREATATFGDLKYWLTDLAVSLLMQSEMQANAAAERLQAQLDALEPYASEAVAAIRADVDTFVEQAFEAVDAYTDDERVLGNSLMAHAREHISGVDERLAELVARLDATAARSREAALAGAARAVELAAAITVAAVLFCVTLTVLLVRSITVPLERLVGAMVAITAGRLDAPVPEPGGDEIGAMARTLALFRDSLIERDRLAAQRERAEAEVRRAQTQLVEAIESISEGFALYDAQDRLVVHNARYRELYDDLDVTIAPGTRYGDIIRAAARSGLVPQAAGHVERWVAERIAQHRNPRAPHEQLRGNGQWLRISERRTHEGGIVGIFSDITELKRREAALREEQQRTAAANRLILESLRYAGRIQSAMLPARTALAGVTADHLLIWEPRDIVGGDFFWLHRTQGGYLVLVGDCTGHGVPGAFMTLITVGVLERLARDRGNDARAPSRLLSDLHRELQALLGQDQGREGDTDDGLDAGLCLVDEAERKLVFAGARLSLWRARDGAIDEIRGDRGGIGYRRFATDLGFSDRAVDLDGRDAFYLATDGLIDQIGGPRRRAFGKRRFASFLAAHHPRPMPEQAAALSETLAGFQGREVRRDDLTVLGFAPLAA